MPLVFDPVWAKPLPEQQLEKIFMSFDYILTVEESALSGGFGSAVLEFANDKGLLSGKVVKRAGVPDHFVEHATQAQQRESLGLDAESLVQEVSQLSDLQMSRH